MQIRFKKLHPDAKVPVYAHEGDAGADLFAIERVPLLPKGDFFLIRTGIAVEIPEGYAGFVQPRSGLATKYGVTVINTPGLIDSHYRGEIKVGLINHFRMGYVVEKGDKIAQLVIQKVENVIG